MTTKYFDLLERALWTFVQGALAVWIATDVDLFSETTLKIAATAGLVAVAKCLLAFQVGSGNTAATLPAGPDSDLGGDEGSVDLVTALVVVFLIVVILVVVGVI